MYKRKKGTTTKLHSLLTVLREKLLLKKNYELWNDRVQMDFNIMLSFRGIIMTLDTPWQSWDTKKPPDKIKIIPYMICRARSKWLIYHLNRTFVQKMTYAANSPFFINVISSHWGEKIILSEINTKIPSFSYL